MTSDEMGKKFEEIETAKNIADIEKELKKAEREERKLQNEVLRNIKKEIVESKKANAKKSEPIKKIKRKLPEQEPAIEPKPKRGRKPKAAQ